MGGWDKGGEEEGRRAYTWNGEGQGRGGERKEGLHMEWGGTREERREEGGLTHGMGQGDGGKGMGQGKEEEDGELTTNRYPPKEIPEFSRKILTFKLRSCSSVAESNSSFLDASGTSARA
jgi:hypothetical protein